MTSTNKKIIAVVGATGNQGSSVANTFLGAGWLVRAITRNPSSQAAQALSGRGAEVVQADLSNLSSLPAAFDSATAIFANTDFWSIYRNPLTASRAAAEGTTSSELAFNEEVSHGVNIAKVAAAVKTLQHFIYSALGPMKKHSNGKYPNSYHWDSKATIVEYIETNQPELAKKMTVIYMGAYASNPLFQPRFNKQAGKYMFVLPLKRDTMMPIIDPNESTGPFVRALVEGEEPGKRFLAYDSYLSMEQVVNMWSKVSGQPAGFMEVTAEFMNNNFGVPLEVLDAPGFIEEFGYMGGVEGVIEPADLTTKVQTKSLEHWLRGRSWEELLREGNAEMKSVANK